MEKAVVVAVEYGCRLVLGMSFCFGGLTKAWAVLMAFPLECAVNCGKKSQAIHIIKFQVQIE